MKRTLLTAVVLLAHSAEANASDVRHVAPAEASPGAALVLTARVSRAWETTIEVRYRPLGGSAWASAEFRRQSETEYAATIPGESVRPPGLEYFIVDHFASPEAPHRVSVYQDRNAVWRERVLERSQDRRARVRVAGEYVDYGTRQIRDYDIPDRYYRLEADFSYLLLSFPLKSLRFGYTRMLGNTPYSSRGQDTGCPEGATEEECTFDAGFKVGGWFELGFAIRDGIELDARGMVMATSEGFNVGGRGEFRVGVADSTHVALGGELIADVGNAAFVRLGWGTVPGFPMATTVEVSDFPAEHRATAVRLLYDVMRPMKGGLRVGLRLGYQARDQRVGGITAGLNTTFDF